MKYNTAVFAAFKNHSEVKNVASLLTDELGNIKPWKQFRDEALKISKKYNVTHLKAEYDRATRSARAATDWLKFEAEKHLYPNLRYIATKDERTREDHMQLDGAVYPIDHEFWNTHYPPNDWGCRCRVEQTTDPINEKKRLNIKADFANNVGKTAQVFTPDSPYVKGANKIWKLKAKAFVERNIKTAEDVGRAYRKYNAYGEEWTKKLFNEVNGGYNVYHALHQFDKRTGKYEKLGGQLLASRGKQVEFLAEIGKAAAVDFRFDGQYWEFKTIIANTSAAIKNQIKAGRKAARVILYFPQWPGEAMVKKGIKRFVGEAKAHGLVQPEVFILKDNGDLVKYL